MNQLRIDAQAAMGQKKNDMMNMNQDFAEALGVANVQSSYRMSLQHESVSDITSLDIANQTVAHNSGRSVTIHIPSSESIIHTHRSGVFFKLEVANCFP